MVIEKYILAAITNRKDSIMSGLPVFYTKSEEELHTVANLLEAILDGIAHQLMDGVYIIVKH